MRTNRDGFTLIEVLVTMAITGLIMTALFGTLQGTVAARDDVEIEMAAVRDGPRILDMIERDLAAMHVYNLKAGSVMRGRSEKPGGLRGDRIDFVCTNDSTRRMPDPEGGDEAEFDVASDLNEVGYRLRTSSLSSDFLELWRREDLFVDEEPLEGGNYEKIHDRVRHFEITYLDHLGEKAEEADEWDMSEKKTLPGAIRIVLELQASPELVGGFLETASDARRTYLYTRVIALPNSHVAALDVRPYLPTRITGRNDNAGAGGGGGRNGAGAFGGDQTGLAGTGGGRGSDTETETNGAAGGSLKDMMENGQLPATRPPNTNFGIFDGKNASFDVKPGADGNLSETDQGKIEDFLNDYRNRYLGKGGGNAGGTGGTGGGN